MQRFILIKIFLPALLFLISFRAFTQNFITDTSQQTASFQKAVDYYHQFLFPETGLYDGSEYTYKTYYPLQINEGHPFFQYENFDTGAIFYNNTLYKKVPLLYDIIKNEVLINDPSRIYIIRLNNERIGWFTIWGHIFVRLIFDTAANPQMHTGFYDLLYNGKISLYKKDLKILKENSASTQGINKYVAETNEYFIKKDNRFYQVTNKKSLLVILNDKKNEIVQFIKKDNLNLRKNKNNALIKIVAYYNGLTR
jgi:hypothetical protein